MSLEPLNVFCELAGSTWTSVSSFFQAVISIFAIVNPIGNLPIFLSLTEDATAHERRRVLRLATLVAFAIIFVMAVGGTYLLHDFFNITLDEFRLAGGLLLIVVGILRIIEVPRYGSSAKEEAIPHHEKQARHTHMAISPIASPLLVGPGSIVVVMLIANRQGVIYSLAASAVCFVAVLAILNWAHIGYRIMGKVGTLAVGRVMNIFIAAIGVHFVVDSLRRIIQS